MLLKNFFLKKLIIILLAIVFLSCNKKEENIIIGGIITGNYKTETIANANIVLMAKLMESSSYSSTFTTLETVYTDEKGEYIINIEAVRATEYKISVFKENYFDKTEIYSPDDISISEENSINIFLNSIAYIKINVNNLLPAIASDYMFFSIFGLTENCYDCCSEEKFEFYGENVSEIIKCKIPGNQDVAIQWNVKSGSDMILYKDTFFVNKFDTTSYNINY